MDKVLAILLGWPAAILILYYRRSIKEFFGDVGFAEKYLGMGGTNTLIVIIGLLLFVGCLMYALGTLQALMNGLVGGFFVE